MLVLIANRFKSIGHGRAAHYITVLNYFTDAGSFNNFNMLT